MNDTVSHDLNQAIAEIHAVRRAIAQDNLDRRAAYVKLAHVCELIEHAITESAPLPRLAAAE